MVFDRILVGFDGSPASDRALALARVLKTPSGSLLALTVAETYYATHGTRRSAATLSEHGCLRNASSTG
jgi:nucleotide-binding universal stress UspA family protein